MFPCHGGTPLSFNVKSPRSSRGLRDLASVEELHLLHHHVVMHHMAMLMHMAMMLHHHVVFFHAHFHVISLSGGENASAGEAEGENGCQDFYGFIHVISSLRASESV